METPPSPSSCWTTPCHVEKWEAQMSNTRHKAEPVSCALLHGLGSRAGLRTLWSIMASQGHSPTLPHGDLCVTTTGSNQPEEVQGPARGVSPSPVQMCTPFRNVSQTAAASLVQPGIFGPVTRASINSFSAPAHLPALSQEIPAPGSFLLQPFRCPACQ